MKKPNEKDPSDFDELDRTMARPARSGDEAPAPDAGAEVDQTLVRPTDAGPTEGEIDATIARTPSRPGKPIKPPVGEPTMRRPRRASPGEAPPADRTQVRRGAGGRPTPARSDLDPTILPSSAKAAEAKDPMIGKILGGCRIEARLGEGGMGTVYRARQLDLDREVAVKTIRPEFATDAESLKRFQREAKAVGKFRTQHVVQIYQVGNDGGVPYIVLELLPGGSLREYAEGKPEGRIEADDAVRFLRESALALADAAEKGLVHRDIKPDNLLLDEHGVVKVTDFGISKVVQQDVSMTLTMGGIVGTPMYMSPEQCRGEELDFRSDMWSLGATFFFLLTARPPAKGSSLLELIRTKNEVRNLDPAKILPAAIPGPLSEVIRKLTMLNRDDRYANYDDLIADLDAIAEGRRGSRLLGSLVRWTAALVVLGGAGFAIQQNWPQIETFVRSAFAKETPPVEPSEPGSPPTPVVDLSGMESEVRAIRGEVPDAVDVAALNRLSDRSNEVSRSLDALPKSADTSALRADIAAVNEEIGSRVTALEEVEARRGRQEELDRLRTRVASGEDLPSAISDLNDLVNNAPAGQAWDDFRNDAKELRRQGRLKWYTSRVTAAEREFEAENGGPKAAATLAGTLVSDLAKESSDSEFDALRARAQKLDRDAQDGVALEQRLPVTPAAKWPFTRLAEWVRSVTDAADATSKGAQTALLGHWVEASVLQPRLADPELLAGARSELERVWGECLKARDEGDVRRVQELNREISTALENVSGLRGLDTAAVVPPTLRAELSAWITKSSKREQVVADIEEAIKTQGEVGTLSGWLSKREAAISVRSELQTRVDQEKVAGDDGLEQVLAKLDLGIAFWKTVTDRTESALQSMAKAQLGGAARVLEMRDLASAGRDPASIPEVTVATEAVRQLQQAFVKALDELDLVAAAQLLQGAESSLAKLPDGLSGKAAATDYLRRCDERLRKLREEVRDMAPVRGGHVKIAVGQPGIDGAYDVASFYIDRDELDRATFKRALAAAALRDISAGELRELQSRDWDAQPDYPALEISRVAAADCLRWRGRSLPTHREWWLAAKGPGANTGFPWAGSKFEDGSELRSQPLEVKNDRRPLSVGGVEVHFLVGNAAEWVSDQLADGTRGAVVGGGFGYSQKDMTAAAVGKVQVTTPSGRIASSIGCRGVLRPREFFGDLAPQPD